MAQRSKSGNQIEFTCLAWIGDDEQVRITTNDPDVRGVKYKGIHQRIKRGSGNENHLLHAMADAGVPRAAELLEKWEPRQ